jgi:hypothetical protein
VGASAYAAVTGALALGAVALLIAHVASGRGHYPPEWQFTLPLGAVAAVLGEALLRRRPGEKLGWVVALLGLTVLVQTFATMYADYSVYVERLPSTPGVFAVNRAPSGFLVPELSALFLLFPTGGLPSRRWRPVALGVILLPILGLPAQLGGSPADSDFPQIPNPLQMHNVFVRDIGRVTDVVQVAVLLACAVSPLLRWRRADDLVRRQLKVLLAAALLWPPVVLVLVLGPKWFTDGFWGQLLFALPVLTMVIAIYIAVSRYRLYDIDRVVSRTVSYAVVTGTLVGVYVGCIALTTQLLPLSSSVGVAASTLAAAAMFQPLRRRVQQVVDRRFNRARYDAARTIDAFAARLREEVDPDLVRTDLLEVTADAVQPTTVSLWVMS